MDRVRLGRALGFGARAAVKTLAQAADAAMSPNPNAPKSAQTQSVATAPQHPASSPSSSTTQRAGNIVTATGRMGRVAWEPVKRHSRELWLQVTGSFFALLALSMGVGAWALHKIFLTTLAAAHTNHAALWSPDVLKFYLATAACLMFTYFSISNFIRGGRSSVHKSQ
jgi:hypothetical protein